VRPDGQRARCHTATLGARAQRYDCPAGVDTLGSASASLQGLHLSMSISRLGMVSCLVRVLLAICSCAVRPLPGSQDPKAPPAPRAPLHVGTFVSLIWVVDIGENRSSGDDFEHVEHGHRDEFVC